MKKIEHPAATSSPSANSDVFAQGRECKHSRRHIQLPANLIAFGVIP